MRLKILVTGKNRKIAKDLCEHLESDRGYLTAKCQPDRNALFDVILAELPKVIIICLGDETIETIRAYNVLRDANRRGNCTTIVISNDQDERIFKKYTELDRAFFLSRPVPLLSLYEKLIKVEEQLAAEGDDDSDVFTVFENENSYSGPPRRKILVVDDDPDQLLHIKDQLSEFYDVTPVRSGEDCFRYLMKRKPDLILLDYLMPDEDGPEVLAKMQTVEEYAEIPVIFLTGVTEKKAVLKTLTELRPAGYIIKPSRKSDIVAKIIQALEPEEEPEAEKKNE
ncbi:MAG: response regulator [Eubacterium sp.]|nr:response regulator [Eubacterium sp.]